MPPNDLDSRPSASYSEGRVHVQLPNGAQLSFPIAGNARLEGATFEQLNRIEVDEEGLRWPDLDEDLCFEGLLRGDYGQFVHRMPLAA